MRGNIGAEIDVIKPALPAQNSFTRLWIVFWILRDERSGLLTHIATESVSLCERMKSQPRFWNSNRRFARSAAQRLFDDAESIKQFVGKFVSQGLW